MPELKFQDGRTGEEELPDGTKKICYSSGYVVYDDQCLIRSAKSKEQIEKEKAEAEAKETNKQKSGINLADILAPLSKITEIERRLGSLEDKTDMHEKYIFSNQNQATNNKKKTDNLTKEKSEVIEMQVKAQVEKKIKRRLKSKLKRKLRHRMRR